MSGRNQEPQIEFRLTWERFDIDPGSLAELRGWMSRQVSALISAFETFTASYPPHYDIEGTMRASSTDVFAPGAARVYGDVEYHPHGGTSMEPTIRNGEVVEVDVAAYRRRGPRRADLVLTRRPLPEKAPPVMKDSSTVLRVIALPGETVEVREGRVYVDGQPLVQPYVETPGSYSFAPKKVPRGKYFVLGDNRSRSADSHLFGWFRRTDIIGRVVLPNLD